MYKLYWDFVTIDSYLVLYYVSFLLHSCLLHHSIRFSYFGCLREVVVTGGSTVLLYVLYKVAKQWLKIAGFNNEVNTIVSFLLEAVREWDFLKIPPETIVDDDSEKLQQMKSRQDDEEITTFTLIISSHLALVSPVVLQPSSN